MMAGTKGVNGTPPVVEDLWDTAGFSGATAYDSTLSKNASVDIGQANANRRVVWAIRCYHSSSGGDLSASTCNGVSGTQLFRDDYSFGEFAVYEADVPSGSGSQNINVTFTGAGSHGAQVLGTFIYTASWTKGSDKSQAAGNAFFSSTVTAGRPTIAFRLATATSPASQLDNTALTWTDQSNGTEITASDNLGTASDVLACAVWQAGDVTTTGTNKNMSMPTISDTSGTVNWTYGVQFAI